MKATRYFPCLLALTLALTTLPGRASAIGADDFLPPAQADTPEARQAAEQIKEPAAVKQEPGIDGKQAVVAATAQDAVNAAVKNMPTGDGCEQIKFPSGLGWVASGSAIYAAKPNPVATLHDQRAAYQKAYIKAKKNLAQTLNGFSSKGMEQLNEELKTISTDTDNLTNVGEKLSESIEERVQGLLRGYVVYSVKDEQKDQHGTITVTIVTTPKTRGQFNRVDPAAVAADSVRDGLNAVLAELQNGLLPPVGGKTISVPATGELAFVGFGSAVVVPNANPAVQAKLEVGALKAAQMRAGSALCGIILGDDIAAKSTLDAESKSLSAEFEEAQRDDPFARNQDQAGVAKLREQKNAFVNTQLTTEQVSSIRSGNLPPGVKPKTFFNADKTLATAVAVYLPSLTAQAAQAGREMRDAQIVTPPGGASPAGGAQGGAMPAQGPSGQVSRDADL